MNVHHDVRVDYLPFRTFPLRLGQLLAADNLKEVYLEVYVVTSRLSIRGVPVAVLLVFILKLREPKLSVFVTLTLTE